jgi:hypothetical protein
MGKLREYRIRIVLGTFQFRICLLAYSLKEKKILMYNTIHFPVVLNGCKTWYPKLREEHSLREFENTVLMRIYGPKRDEIIVN